MATNLWGGLLTEGKKADLAKEVRRMCIHIYMHAWLPPSATLGCARARE